MSRYPRHTDAVHKVVLTEIGRCFWSRKRAFHGDEVKLHVETRYVADGSELKLSIWQSGGEGNEEDGLIQRLEDTIESNERILDYRIEWEQERIVRSGALRGDVLEFYFVAELPEYALKARSNLMYVDLKQYQFSE